MAGRPRKPTALKLLTGNPGRHKLNAEEPKPPLGGEPPKWLSQEALEMWRDVCAELDPMRIRTRADKFALGILCKLLVQAASLSDVAMDPRLASELRGYFGRFGLTAADRSRVSGSPAEEKSKLSRFMGGAKKA